MSQEKENQPGKMNNEKDSNAGENNVGNNNEETSSEIKNANASGLGALGRSDETIEKNPSNDDKDKSIPY